MKWKKKRTQEYQVSVLAGSAVGRRLSKLLSTRRIGVCDQVTLKSAISAKSTSKILQRTCNGLAVFWPTMDLAEI